MVTIKTGRHHDPNALDLQNDRLGCVRRRAPAILSARLNDDRHQAQHVVFRHRKNAVPRSSTPRVKLRRRNTMLARDIGDRDAIAITFKHDLGLHMFPTMTPTTRNSHNINMTRVSYSV